MCITLHEVPTRFMRTHVCFMPYFIRSGMVYIAHMCHKYLVYRAIGDRIVSVAIDSVDVVMHVSRVHRQRVCVSSFDFECSKVVAIYNRSRSNSNSNYCSVHLDKCNKNRVLFFKNSMNSIHALSRCFLILHSSSD